MRRDQTASGKDTHERSDGSYVVIVNGADYNILAEKSGEGMNVRMDGTAHEISFKNGKNQKYFSSATSPFVPFGVKAGKPLLAPVAGTLLKHAVPSGSVASVGQTFLIIESMKRELEIRSQAADTVIFIVSHGTQLLAVQVLAEFS